MNLFNKSQNVKFVLIGDGELRRDLQRFCNELHLSEHVHFYGWVSDVSVVYSDLAVLALTSLNEGTPVSVIEAMASNVPVVTQKDTRREEIIGNAGILVNCEDADEFAKALSETAKREWDNIPLNQAKKYNWEVIKKKYFDLIKETLN